jgi:glycosyltransferase involved in cell wall biosynthesis
MIIGDFEPLEFVQRSIDSVKDYVDGMYITVTYRDQQPETSPLIELLKQYGAEVSFFKWTDDFSEARQFALDQVPRAENNYVYWQDVDDVLKGSKYLREALDTAVRWQWAGVFFTYWYRVLLDDNQKVREILIEQKRERIIRNDGTYRWKGMLHETLIGQRQENFQQRSYDKCIVVHLSNDERIDIALERNIRILEKQAELEQHKDPRTLIYLAKGYYDRGSELFVRTKDEDEAKKLREEWYSKALALFDEYLQGKGDITSKDYIEQSGWPEERASAWQYVSQIFLIKGDLDAAMDAINQAIEEAEQFPQYYIDKAVLYTHLKEYRKAKHWLNLATAFDMPTTTLMVAPRDMKVRALECDAHIAMYYDRDLKRVADDYQQLLEVDPGNETYQQNLRVATSLDAANKGMQSVVYLGKYLEQIGEAEKIVPLLQAVPIDFQKEPFYAQMRHKHIPPRLWDEDEIAILCGPGFEPWTPKSIEKGLGGSEEAVVYLGQELAKLGWRVTVYANPESEEGNYDGVTYLNYYKLNPDDLFNHLILWRGIGFVDIKPKTRGKIMLWLHDMPNVPDFTPERLTKVNKIAVLSNFHRQQVQMYENEKFVPIPDDKFFLTRNGIPDLGITTWKGNPHRICYVSSPDRGLMYLLKHWKEVKAAVPDAELHVYYGFEIYDYIHRNNPAKIAFKKKIMALMDQEGITYHGRIGHKELAEEINKCGIWAYPTDFTEISCISAMKAQALGAVPVVTNFAALQETVRNGVRVDVDIQDKEGQKIYFDTLIDVLKDPKQQEQHRDMAWAQSFFSWTNIAKQWDGLLRGENDYQEIMMTPADWQKYLQDNKK